MAIVQFTKLYPRGKSLHGNFVIGTALLSSTADTNTSRTVSLLRSRLSHLVSDEILGRFSSSLPPLFAPGRFATFLSSAR